MTLISYIDILSSMQVIYIQPALDESKMRAAPKKAKKSHFLDPFIYHAIKAWLDPTEEELLNDSELLEKLTESAAVMHVNRISPCYYIKAEGEVDIAYTKDEQIFPIEIKWTNQLRAKELKQIIKYPNASIWSKSSLQEIHGIKNSFLPRIVMELI